MSGARVSAALIAALKTRFDARVSTAAAVREQHGRGEAYHPTKAPDVVVFATSTQEVSEIVRMCAAEGAPIVAFGAGTSLEGHVCALQGGVCIDLSRMNEIVELNVEDLDVTVQAGVTRKQLNAYLRDQGLFFPVDPGADATIGGMAATRASGTNAVRYGTMRENVLSLTVVLADGRIIRTRSRARKSSAGYDLTALFVGAEGTLGIITEVTLRLQGIPENMTSAVCPYPSVEAAIEAVIETIQTGIPVARIEIMDAVTVAAVNAYSKLNLEARPTLFYEFHGSAAGAAEQAQRAQEIAAGHGGEDFRWASDPAERARLWEARHNIHYATLAMRPGAKSWGTDVCVPISKLAEMLRESRKDNEGASFPVTLVGHVGDGNFHHGYIIDPDNAAEMAEAERLNKRLVERAIALGGTCTGEHGVGYGKIKFMRAEHGEAIEVMKTIKRALDPQGLMNPGKVLPD
ncbi:MAG: FAD-binding protein [Methylobacteriaceae bacterium]|nr:FAD-binding protein [Methylobacteriaceae bacterium]